MVDSVTGSKSLGFENLMLAGWKRQLQEGAAALREGKSQGQGLNPSNDEVSPEDLRRIEQLKATDRRVRAHEQAHVAVGGELVLGGANFSYETGPDERRYAVAGEVAIDTSKESTPEATIPKAQHIRQTALAPADPSPQDRQVASLAAQMETQARLDAATRAAEERSRAESDQAGRAIGAYQAAAGVESSAGFSAIA